MCNPHGQSTAIGHLSKTALYVYRFRSVGVGVCAWEREHSFEWTHAHTQLRWFTSLTTAKGKGERGGHVDVLLNHMTGSSLYSLSEREKEREVERRIEFEPLPTAPVPIHTEAIVYACGLNNNSKTHTKKGEFFPSDGLRGIKGIYTHTEREKKRGKKRTHTTNTSDEKHYGTRVTVHSALL